MYKMKTFFCGKNKTKFVILTIFIHNSVTLSTKTMPCKHRLYQLPEFLIIPTKLYTQ